MTKFQAPSSNTFQDILLKWFHSDFFKMPTFSKGHNSGKIRWIHSSWDTACIRFHSNFSKGHNSEKEVTQTRKKKCVSAIFPLGIHIWNFKTLACTVLDEPTDAHTDGQPETNKPRQLLQVGGIIRNKSFNGRSLDWHTLYKGGFFKLAALLNWGGVITCTVYGYNLWLLWWVQYHRCKVTCCFSFPTEKSWASGLYQNVIYCTPCWIKDTTVMFLSFQTDTSGQTVETQIRLILEE